MKNKKFRNILIGIIFIGILLLLVFKLDIFNKDNIQGLLEEGMDKGALIIIIMTILMVFFVPLTWFTLVGAIFLDFKGYVYIMISAILASMISFFIARIFRDDMMGLISRMNNRKKKPLDLNSISNQIEDYGVGYLFFLRSVPLTPYGLINYVSGISSIGVKDYIVGTLLGLLPAETINVYLMKAVYNIGSSFRNAILMLILKVVYTLFVIIYHRSRRKYY